MKLPFSPRPGTKRTVLGRLRQLAIILGLLAVLGYAGAVSAGYLWLAQVRKVEHLNVADVALFRWQNVRRAMAAQQFTRAQAEWDAKNFQAAYVAYSTAVRQDPDNLPGRLAAARFFRAVGAANLGQILLEEGLARSPDDKALIEATLDTLLATGRDRHVIELLRQIYPRGFAGPNQPLLETRELLATLTIGGPAEARRLLGSFPDLDSYSPAAPVVARVYWDAGERPKALALLAAYVRTPTATFEDYLRLGDWQATSGHLEVATKTAEQACAKFPGDLRPRVVLIELHAAAANGQPLPQDIDTYLRNYAGRPEAVPMLAALAATRGWVELARSLYDLGAVRHANLYSLAFCYTDALARNSRYAESQTMLGQIEAQTPEAGTPFLVQLRQRQIVAAAALGQSETVRDYARRLGATLGNDPDGLEICRRIFQQLKIAEAVAELTPRVVPARVPAGKKS